VCVYVWCVCVCVWCVCVWYSVYVVVCVCVVCAFGVVSKKPSPNPRAQRFTPRFS